MADGAREEVLLDQNMRAVGFGYYRAVGLTVSPDHRRLAWGEDRSGSEEFTAHVMDLETGAILSDAIPGTSGNLAWAADSETLFYVTLDTAHRPNRVWRHRVGAAASDALVYEERDEAFWVGVELSKSRPTSSSSRRAHATSETRYAPADRPETAFRIVRPRMPGIEYDVTHRGDRFYLVTNKGARNFQLVSVPTSDPATSWQVVIPGTESVKLDAVEAFAGHLVVYEREGGLPQVRIIDIDAGMSHRVAFPEPVYNVRRHANPEWTSRVVRFTYASLVTPASVIDYDMDAQSWTLRKEQVIPSGYDRTLYRSARLLATASDGVQVPISLVWKEPFERNGQRPMYLQGYGSYGINFDPSFSYALPQPARPGIRRRASPTCVAARKWGAAGTTRESRGRSGTPSPISSPAPSTWWPRNTRRATGSRLPAVAPAACSWVRSPTCARISSRR
jgi:oligopeptidase B